MSCSPCNGDKMTGNGQINMRRVFHQLKWNFFFKKNESEGKISKRKGARRENFKEKAIQEGKWKMRKSSFASSVLGDSTLDFAVCLIFLKYLALQQIPSKYAAMLMKSSFGAMWIKNGLLQGDMSAKNQSLVLPPSPSRPAPPADRLPPLNGGWICCFPLVFHYSRRWKLWENTLMANTEKRAEKHFAFEEIKKVFCFLRKCKKYFENLKSILIFEKSWE